jgi:hypothetical protein
MVADDYVTIEHNGIGKENSMRNNTVTLRSNLTNSHFSVAHWLSSLASIVEYLFRTLSFIPRIINAFPIPIFSNFGQISPNTASVTAINSTTFILEITQNTPSENAKLRVKL